MATKLTTITNISNQTVPILVNPIEVSKANSLSNLAATKAEQTGIAPAAQLRVESQRIDVGQLDRLRDLGLIRYESN